MFLVVNNNGLNDSGRMFLLGQQEVESEEVWDGVTLRGSCEAAQCSKTLIIKKRGARRVDDDK